MNKQLDLPNIIDYSKDKWELMIEYDGCVDSPRDWDNLGQICVSNRCKYTDDESGLANILTWYDLDKDTETLERKGYIVLPLSVYDHSEVRIYVGSPYDRWDSGRIGFYITSKENICKKYGVKRISKKLLEEVESVMESEIKIYNAYLNGQVFRFTLLHNDEYIDSCGGFYEAEDTYLGFIENIYKHLPKVFTDAFTVEQTEEMAILPW